MRNLYYFLFTFFVMVFIGGCFGGNLLQDIKNSKLGVEQWKVKEINFLGVDNSEKVVDVGSKFGDAWIKFDLREFRIYGNSGCNGYFGTYVWDGMSKIVISNTGMTRKMCDGEVNEFEQQFMPLLEDSFLIERDGGSLKLSSSKMIISLEK